MDDPAAAGGGAAELEEEEVGLLDGAGWSVVDGLVERVSEGGAAEGEGGKEDGKAERMTKKMTSVQLLYSSSSLSRLPVRVV